VKGVAEAYADLSKLLKKSENMDPNSERFSIKERMFMVHYLLTCESMMKNKRKKPRKPPWTHF